MIDAMISYGGGYKGHWFHDLCDYLLAKNIEEVKKFVESFRSTWKEIGCTMVDG